MCESHQSGHTFWVHLNSVLMGHRECYMYMWWQGTGDTHLHASCLLYFPIVLHLQNSSTKIKSLRIARWWEQSTKPSTKPFWFQDPVWLHNCIPIQVSLSTLDCCLVKWESLFEDLKLCYIHLHSIMPRYILKLRG